MVLEQSDSDVYLDTAFVVNAVIRQAQDSTACIEATEQLIDSQRTAYFSQVLRIEYARRSGALRPGAGCLMTSYNVSISTAGSAPKYVSVGLRSV